MLLKYSSCGVVIFSAHAPFWHNPHHLQMHHRDKISNTIELFREVTHPLAKGEEAGKIFAKYEQLYAGLAM